MQYIIVINGINMNTLRLMKVFVTVAEESGFASAARRLSMSPAAVTRAVSQLEDQLGVLLLQRSTRFVRPTEAGYDYLESARRILEDVKTANASVRGEDAEPSGLLNVTAPILFGQMFVMPSITRYLQSFTDTRIEALFLDRVVNMLEEGIDVALRIGHLPDSNARAKRVGSVRVILCASPEYIETHGIPNDPTELSQHTLISSRALNPIPEWRFNFDGKSKSVKIEPRLIVTSNAAAIEAARSGFGITRLISYQVAPYLENGTLKILLENYEQPPMPIHILHREGHLITAKVRSFVDALAEDLRSNSNLN